MFGTEQTPPPSTFDGFRLVRLIGRGAMGQVFLAQDTLLDREVAIKFLAGIEAGEANRERMLHEARTIARLHHPNVVAVYRFGEVEGRPYLVTELVRGKALHKMRLPLPPERALEVALGISRGLAAAHRSGVVHRDVKPANVLITEQGEIKLVDFGLAELVDPAARAPDWELSGAAGSTQPTMLVGTPLYMAPEIFLGERATVRSDVYSLGAVLYHICAGRTPHTAEDTDELAQIVTSRDARPLAEAAPGRDARLHDVVDRCLRRDPAERWTSAEEVRAVLEAIAAGAPLRGALFAGANPYRGLHVFEEEDRALFFGRELEARTVAARLRDDPWVLVAGDSGIGKSSLCRAGIIPAITEQGLGDGREWRAATMVPGARPVTALTAALARFLGVDEQRLTRDIASDLNAVDRALAARLEEHDGIVLLVDQMEELVTQSERSQAMAFAEILGRMTGGRAGIRVLATARTDFLSRMAALFGMTDELNRALFVLGPLRREDIREAIVGPARAAGVRFESDEMIERLVESTASADGALPLLQFALAELWRIRDQVRQVIPMAALEAIGGVEGALSRHGDEVLARLGTTQRAAARRALGQLVTGEGLRARRTDVELGAERPEVRAALDALVGGRLVVAREADGGTAYEVAHEALIQGWGTLRAWLEADLELRSLRERIVAAAVEWERLGRGREGLWRERQLAEAHKLPEVDLGARELEFLRSSGRAVRRRRTERRALFIALPAIVAIAYGAVRWNAAREVAHRVDEKLAIARAAHATDLRRTDELDRLMREAFARFDAQELDLGESLWARARAQAETLDRSYVQSLRHLDTALLLDSGRPDVRAAIADLLLARATLAERLRRPAQAAEYIERLAVFDDDGARRRAFDAPGILTITTQPPAKLTLARVEDDPSGRRHLEQLPDIPSSLHPGSYVLTATAPGRADVVAPFMIARGERLTMLVELPAAASVPPGFVYVPPGRFLFGHAGDESLRREFMTTVPLHTVTTPAYLIARHETTYGEWLEFLRDLPPAERKARTPGTASGFHGALVLEEGAQGWAIMMQPATRAYRARAGEKIHYEGRRVRADQDWLRFPVGGISADTAKQYTAWLDRTGRVHGARLCSELEWERAARGADDRVYPHGDTLAPGDANFDESYGKVPEAFGPDEVGAHPASRSPFGLDDMAGNVWEWTTSSIGPPGVAARSGSYFFARMVATAPNRQLPSPEFQDLTVGLRVCAVVQ